MKFVALLAFFLSATAFCNDAENVWQHETTDDSAGGSESFVLRQASSATIKDQSAKNEVTPQIEFFCSPSQPTMMARINWNRFISSFSTEAGFKVDDGNFNWLKWKVDSSEQVTYSPSASDSERLIDLLSEGTELVVDISPYSEAPVQAYFDISNFAAELSKTSANCQ